MVGTHSRCSAALRMTEAHTQRLIQLHASRLGHRLWRNNGGQAWVGQFIMRRADGSVLLRDARPLRAGLMQGSSDLIGITSTGRFLSVEVKSERGRLSAEQRAWIEMIQRFGGLAGEARSIEDFEAILCDP